MEDSTHNIRTPLHDLDSLSPVNNKNRKCLGKKKQIVQGDVEVSNVEIVTADWTFK